MKKILGIFILSCFSLGISEHSVQIWTSKGIGTALYDLEFSEKDEIPTGSDSLIAKSELDFPLDQFFLGVDLVGGRKNYTDSISDRPFTWSIGAWAAISPAFSQMQDLDWAGLRFKEKLNTSSTSVRFSDTKSDVESGLFGIFGVKGNMDLWRTNFIGIPNRIGIGFDYLHAFYRVYGLEGWYLGNYNVKVYHSLPYSLRVGTYRTDRIAFGLTVRPSKKLLFTDWLFQLKPMVVAFSEDDHMFRNKLISMTTYGFGASLQGDWPIKTGNFQIAPFVETNFHRTWGKMGQRFYDDDPGTPSLNETGIEVDDLDTKVIDWRIQSGCKFSL